MRRLVDKLRLELADIRRDLESLYLLPQELVEIRSTLKSMSKDKCEASRRIADSTGSSHSPMVSESHEPARFAIDMETHFSERLQQVEGNIKQVSAEHDKLRDRVGVLYNVVGPKMP